MPSVDGAWTANLSGGLPPLETWSSNPQFAITPTVEGAQYTIEVVRKEVDGKTRCGLWLMKGDAAEGRKTEFTGMVKKTNVSTSEKRSIGPIALPALKGGKPYIASVATVDPGITGSFTISVTSVEDTDVMIVPLQEGPGGQAAKPKPTNFDTNFGAASVKPKPLGSFAPMQPSKPAKQWSPDSGSPPDNVPTLEVLGQGLSKKLENECKEKVAAASASAGSGLYEDAEFPASDASLGQSAAAYGVVDWKRLSEIEAPPKKGAGGLLERAEGVGLQKPAALNDEWLLGALNVVGGNIEVVERTFVDMSHLSQGFVVVRLWAEDPNSDDDWAIVVVDDRLPVGDDGLPAFCRGAKPGALWAALVEKAVAKRYGSYAKLAGQGGGETTLRGMELITGGKARELTMVGPKQLSDKVAMATCWAGIKEAFDMNEVVAVRVDSNTNGAESQGLVPGRTYCLIVANDMMGGDQQMMKLRGFAGDPEWTGKWSDQSDAWTSRLRQMLAYSKDSDDGTFWMEFKDFAKYFTSAYATKVADDQWNRFWVKSRWMDETAGGGPSYTSWRNNYQWLLSLPRDTQLTIELSLPDPKLSSDNLLAIPPIGLLVCHGNGAGPNARRRKLKIENQSEIVFQANPKSTRRLQVPVRLPASPAGAPYVLVPYVATPGAESPFKLSILVDDLDDDGKPDIKFEPCLPYPTNPEDWSVKRSDGPWGRSTSAPNTPGFERNDRIGFKLNGSGEGKVVCCLETVGINTDMRLKEGMQTSAEYPSIGLAILPNAEGPPSEQAPSNALISEPVAKEGLWFECMLPAGQTHMAVPFLTSMLPSGITYTLTIYSELPIESATAAQPAVPTGGGGGIGGPWECECIPTSEGGHGEVCPFRVIVEKMDKMEKLMDERLAFLESIQ